MMGSEVGTAWLHTIAPGATSSLISADSLAESQWLLQCATVVQTKENR